MFKEVKKNFGFGCMRLPMKENEVDIDQVKNMVDLFLAQGFNYFDTAHGYIQGKSELAIKEALTKRYPRDSYILTNKLTDNCFQTEEDIRPFFESQLELCGVSYFDFYLMHAQNARNFEKYKATRAYETAFALKKEGKIRHVGLSFHDQAKVLDEILTTYPEIEVVQIQFNYLDYNDSGIQSRLCYEVARKHHKPIIVMEPVKGGRLIQLPLEAKHIFNALGDLSPASYAIRYAASFDGIFMVLSGMSTLEQMQDNVSYMKEFHPLEAKEKSAIEKVKIILQQQRNIECTGCAYCVAGCPKNIQIPAIFADYNTKLRDPNWNGTYYYGVHTYKHGKASDCISCGKCEAICPQGLPIRKILKDIIPIFEA